MDGAFSNRITGLPESSLDAPAVDDPEESTGDNGVHGVNSRSNSSHSGTSGCLNDAVELYQSCSNDQQILPCHDVSVVTTSSPLPSAHFPSPPNEIIRVTRNVDRRIRVAGACPLSLHGSGPSKDRIRPVPLAPAQCRDLVPLGRSDSPPSWYDVLDKTVRQAPIALMTCQLAPATSTISAASALKIACA